MWPFSKKKKIHFDVRYRIAPYKDIGFIVEKHVGNSDPEVWSKNVVSVPNDVEYKEKDQFLGRGMRNTCFTRSYYLYGTIKIFETKEKARDLIDRILYETNRENARKKESDDRIERFAKYNPPEWYP